MFKEITKNEQLEFEKERDELINVVLVGTVKRLKEISERSGILANNKEYADELKYREHILKRIEFIGDILNDTDVTTNIVEVGSIVTLYDTEEGEVFTCLVVEDSQEIETEHQIAKVSSDLGQVIMGKHIGDRVSIDRNSVKSTFNFIIKDISRI